MAPLGFGLIVGGALLIYAGMTGGSLVAALRQVLAGDKDTTGPTGPTGTDARRDQAQTTRPAQP